MTSSNAKKVSKKNATATKATVTTSEKATPKKAVEQPKKVSNTQKCADMIVSLARDAKHTRNEIVATVSDALTALSIVTVKTMLSDLQNSKYAKRYSSHIIAVDKRTKIVSIASEIKECKH